MTFCCLPDSAPASHGLQPLLRYDHPVHTEIKRTFMTTIEEFTSALESEFEDLEPGTLKPDTAYRSVKGWSSMHALIIIAFMDANFDITVTGADLRATNTIRDLYNLVKEKK